MRSIFSIEFAEIVLYFLTRMCLQLQQKLLQLGWRIGSSSSKLQKQLLQPAASVLCPFVPLNPTSNQPLQPIWIFWVIDQPTLLQKGVEDSLKLFSICSNAMIRIKSFISEENKQRPHSHQHSLPPLQAVTRQSKVVCFVVKLAIFNRLNTISLGRKYLQRHHRLVNVKISNSCTQRLNSACCHFWKHPHNSYIHNCINFYPFCICTFCC